jgi:hypothetical protein
VLCYIYMLRFGLGDEETDEEESRRYAGQGGGGSIGNHRKGNHANTVGMKKVIAFSGGEWVVKN